MVLSGLLPKYLTHLITSRDPLPLLKVEDKTADKDLQEAR